MTTGERSEAARIRASLKHPVIDSDGHIVESQPAAMTYLARSVSGERKIFARSASSTSQLYELPYVEGYFFRQQP